MNEDAVPSKNTISTGGFIVVTLLTCLTLTWWRMWYVQSPADWYYIEDSNTFLTTANYLGLPTLFRAYSGYHHLVVRVCALIASLFDM
ncbi:MAG: hypothetical protein LBR29_10995, partial [Methylobacteriaceae bacterium]|nr:hypothetical protein [Methylobacteriaceae bacterium]